MEFRRKLYARGNSFETTIPRPILFDIDAKDKHDVLFSYDAAAGEWRIKIVPREER